MNVQAPNEVHHGVAEAVGNLASVVAFSAFDIANYTASDRCFNFALWCAEEAGSWALRVNTLAEMARKAAYLGDLDYALEPIEFAQVRSDRLTATARAMLHTIRARLLALTGRYAEAQADVDRADTHFVDHGPEADPPWLCYYDAAEHQGSTGKALIPIARARGRELAGSAHQRSRATVGCLSSLADILPRPACLIDDGDRVPTGSCADWAPSRDRHRRSTVETAND